MVFITIQTWKWDQSSHLIIGKKSNKQPAIQQQTQTPGPAVHKKDKYLFPLTQRSQPVQHQQAADGKTCCVDVRVCFRSFSVLKIKLSVCLYEPEFACQYYPSTTTTLPNVPSPNKRQFNRLHDRSQSLLPFSLITFTYLEQSFTLLIQEYLSYEVFCNDSLHTHYGPQRMNHH